jgi:ankyrin repeat protein
MSLQSLQDEATTAVARGNLQWLRAALRQQPSLANAKDSDGYTLLQRAAFWGSTECLRVLLATDACIEAATAEEGFRALYMAAQEGHDACVRELLAAGANFEAAAMDGVKRLPWME